MYFYLGRCQKLRTADTAAFSESHFASYIKYARKKYALLFIMLLLTFNQTLIDNIMSLT